MMRFFKLFVLCSALLVLFPSAGMANAQAAASPCAAPQGQVDTTACAEFLTYLRDSSQHWSGSTSVIVPESTMGEASARYVSHWDDNPVAYIPESTMGEASARYVPHWDDNPVAYIPESTMGEASTRYIPHWDDNPVAYIPESTMDVSMDEILGLR